MRITYESYKVHPEINFKNVYIDNHRRIPEKEIDRYLDKIVRRVSIEEKLDKFINFIKGIFKK